MPGPSLGCPDGTSQGKKPSPFCKVQFGVACVPPPGRHLPPQVRRRIRTVGAVNGAEVVTFTVDEVTRKTVEAAAADERVASVAASAEDAAMAEEGADAAMSRTRPARVSTWR